MLRITIINRYVLCVHGQRWPQRATPIQAMTDSEKSGDTPRVTFLTWELCGMLFAQHDMNYQTCAPCQAKQM